MLDPVPDDLITHSSIVRLHKPCKPNQIYSQKKNLVLLCTVYTMETIDHQIL